MTTRGLAVAFLVVALAGCALDAPDPPRQPSSPPTSAPPASRPPVPPEDGSLRKRLVDGLAATDPSQARLVETGQLTIVRAKWLAGWQVVDVVNSTLPHPRRFYLGLSTDGAVVFLTANTENFNRMIASSDAHITSAKVATEVAETFLDTNRTFLKSSYRLERIEDIRWLPKLTAGQAGVRGQVESTYGPKIAKPKARKSGAGWRVAVWMVYDHQLVRHDLDIAGNGLVTDSAETAFDGLPTPDSI